MASLVSVLVPLFPLLAPPDIPPCSFSWLAIDHGSRIHGTHTHTIRSPRIPHCACPRVAGPALHFAYNYSHLTSNDKNNNNNRKFIVAITIRFHARTVRHIPFGLLLSFFSLDRFSFSHFASRRIPRWLFIVPELQHFTRARVSLWRAHTTHTNTLSHVSRMFYHILFCHKSIIENEIEREI